MPIQRTGPEKGAKISNVQAETLESGDVAEELKDGSAHLSASTSTELDGMTFDATPGAVESAQFT